MDMESLPRFLAMAQDTSSKWADCFLHIKQTEIFVEAKTAEQECLTGMPNVSPDSFESGRSQRIKLIYLCIIVPVYSRGRIASRLPARMHFRQQVSHRTIHATSIDLS